MLQARNARQDDCMLYYKWANDSYVREQSFNSNPIEFENHKSWFLNVLEKENIQMLVFEENSIPVGQVRIQPDSDSKTFVIGISIDADYRGKRLGVEMLNIAAENFFRKWPEATINAYIKKDNLASFHIFQKAGYGDVKDIVVNGSPSIVCTKYKKNENR